MARTPRSVDPSKLRRHLDAVLLRQLRAGKVTRMIGGQAVECDLPSSLLDVARKRLCDLTRLGDPAEDDPDSLQAAVKRSIVRARAEGEAPSPEEVRRKAAWLAKEAKHAAHPDSPRRHGSAAAAARYSAWLQDQIASLQAAINGTDTHDDDYEEEAPA